MTRSTAGLVRAFLFWCALARYHCSLIFDKNISYDVSRYASTATLGREELVFAFRDLPRRPGPQDLIAVQGHHFSIRVVYNYEENTVTLQSYSEKLSRKNAGKEEDNRRDIEWKLQSQPSRPLKDLALVITASTVRLVDNCQSLIWQPMDGRHNLMPKLEHNNIALYRGNDIKVNVFGNEKKALDYLGCGRGPDYQVQDKQTTEQPRVPLKAGSITPTPQCLAKSDIDAVVSELTVLRETVTSLAATLQECCARMTANRRCSKHSCYPGVQCEDSEDGFQCGPCPKGFEGDGKTCKSTLTCDEINCIEGECKETPTGPACKPCSNDTFYDGRRCVHICAAGPCRTNCKPVRNHPYYECEPCPIGFEWNGRACVDMDECATVEPCDKLVSCINSEGGFECGACPAGWRGGGWRGAGVARLQRTCADVDECSERAPCPEGWLCVNTPGSYACLQCGGHFYENTNISCYNATALRCQPEHCKKYNAVCGFGLDCVCAMGFAGNGTVCGTDTDLDGFPDETLACAAPRCRADNCRGVANSGQEDADADGLGDACDGDSDGDAIDNNSDNCPLIANADQLDVDNDKTGDACDNCETIKNYGQEDTDHDGIGDACDPDIDNDDIENAEDNCPFKYNPDQKDADLDTVGDECDNCPSHENPAQDDSDKDGAGDKCDYDEDRDGDGSQDGLDNCVDVPNAGQEDADGDGRGDACDDDDDGDGVKDEKDNCPLVANHDQLDFDNDGVGDKCQEDNDGDNVTNALDNCPNNAKINRINFGHFMQVDLISDSDNHPSWVMKNQGAEIVQNENADPSLMVGYESFAGVDFEGTLFVKDDWDDDFIGFIFAYQSNKRFYLMSWKKVGDSCIWDSPFSASSNTGIHLKLVNSETGPSDYLRNSLWNTESVRNQITLLWRDPKEQGWELDKAYRYRMIHRPHVGLIRLKVYDGSTVIVDSGNVYDSTLNGGRLGLYCFSQGGITWSNLVYRCNEKIPSNLMSELPEGVQKSSVEDHNFIF